MTHQSRNPESWGPSGGSPSARPRYEHERTDLAERRQEELRRGFLRDVLPVLFDPFRKTNHRRQGSERLGLGLFITSQIVRSHAGSIDVQSSGGTTTFVVRLPRR